MSAFNPQTGTARRVYFVGAGFSAGMCYPVGNSLTSRLVEYLQGKHQLQGLPGSEFINSLGSRGLRRRAEEIGNLIVDFLNKYFRISLDNLHKVGVAEFFTMASSLAETPSLFGLEDDEFELGEMPDAGPLQARHLFSALACLTRTYFIDICRSQDYPKDIRDLLDHVDPRTSAIINFNWDEEVDIYLTSSNYRNGELAYSRAAWRPSRKLEDLFLLLRPHGSIGWYDITQGIGNRYTYLIAEKDSRIRRSQKRIVAFSEVGWPKDLANGKFFPKLTCPPLITPPTFAKRFQYKEQHQIWRDVLEVCAQAREFIFLGYSLPPDDYLTRAAICSSLTDNGADPAKCLIVGLDPGVLDNFTGIFGEALSIESHFLQWRFGCNKKGLARKIEENLRDVSVRR
jgi:hypothetical protein